MVEKRDVSAYSWCMFKIKICGITNVEDAQIAEEAGADAIGLNFFPGSKRFVELDQAITICSSIGSQLLKVGVFVNESVENMIQISEHAKLNAIQLHGDEGPDIVAKLSNFDVIKAFRCRDGQLDPVVDFLRESDQMGVRPNVVLLDAYDPDNYGGSGKTIELSKLIGEIDSLSGQDWILAGGLTPDNIAAAIRKIGPHGVDTASGVEMNPRKKDREKTVRFIDQARQAFALH